MEIIVTAVISAFFSGLFGTWLANRHHRFMLIRMERRDLLGKLFEYKLGFLCDPTDPMRRNLVSSLNKIDVIFYDNKIVLEALNTLYIALFTKNNKEYDLRNEIYNDLFSDLVIKMSKDKYVGMGNNTWTSEFITRVFH